VSRPERPWAPEPDQPGRVLDARLHLLDRQVLDVDGVPVTTVDDLEVEPMDGSATDPPGQRTTRLTAILTGPVLATRVFGGRPPRSRWVRIPWALVTDVGTALRLGSPGAALDATWTERWVRDHVIARIPGGRHDPG
jgi:sporulation protein YlmC with PRC-barrel domain